VQIVAAKVELCRQVQMGVDKFSGEIAQVPGGLYSFVLRFHTRNKRVCHYGGSFSGYFMRISISIAKLHN
jgi:hypothetical protein